MWPGSAGCASLAPYDATFCDPLAAVTPVRGAAAPSAGLRLAAAAQVVPCARRRPGCPPRTRRRSLSLHAARRAPGRTRRSSTAPPTTTTSGRRGPNSAEGRWVPYDEARPFRPTSGTCGAPSFLDNLWIEVIDEPYENGVHRQARHLPHRGAAARQDRRLRAARWARSSKVDVSKIEATLQRTEHRACALDSFVDESTMRQVTASFASSTPRRATTTRVIDPTLEQLPGGSKLDASDVQHRSRAEGRDSRRSSSTATRRSPTASCAIR